MSQDGEGWLDGRHQEEAVEMPHINVPVCVCASVPWAICHIIIISLVWPWLMTQSMQEREELSKLW